MKFKSLCLFYLPLILVILSVPSCLAAKSEVRTNVTINVYADMTYDFHMSKDFGELRFGTQNWTWYFMNEQKNVQIYDSYGNAIIKSAEKKGEDLTFYNFDLNHIGPISGPIYVNSSGELKNSSYLHLGFSIDTYNTNTTYDNVILQATFPDSLTLLTQCDFNISKFCAYAKNATLSFTNPSGNIYFSFFNSKDFSQIEDSNKIYFVENNDTLNESVTTGLEHKDLIFNFPKEKEDAILVTFGNASEIAKEEVGGVYVPNENAIVIEKEQSDTEDAFLHELTHYSNYAGSQEHIFPDWLEEGSARYTEVKFFDLNNPNSNYLKPSLQNLEQDWYNLSDANYLSYLNDVKSYKYAIGGFIVNHYAKTYGEGALKLAFIDIDRKVEIEANATNDTIEKISEDSLIMFSGANITKIDLFFPQKDLLVQNKTAFEKIMMNFTSDQRSYNYGNGDMSVFFYAGIVIGIILVFAVPVGIIIVIAKFLARKKKTKRQK